VSRRRRWRRWRLGRNALFVGFIYQAVEVIVQSVPHAVRRGRWWRGRSECNKLLPLRRDRWRSARGEFGSRNGAYTKKARD
jgi:hypothetical protein